MGIDLIILMNLKKTLVRARNKTGVKMRAWDMLAVRVEPKTFKELKLLCVEKEISLQAYVTKLIEEALAKEKEA